MRIRRSLVLLLSVCTLLNALAPSAYSADDIRKDPNKAVIPTGLNSAINLSSALLAIDDKSPMASSIGSNYGAVSNFTEAQKGYLAAQLTPLIPANSILPKNKKQFEKFLDQAIRSPSGDLQNAYATLNFTGVNGLDKTALGQPGYGKFLTNRLLLIEYLLEKFPSLQKGITANTNFTQGQINDLDKQLSRARETVKKSLYYGSQVRGGGGPTIYTPEVIYSDGRRGYDVAAQSYLSELYGYGISARLDLTPGRPEMVRQVLAADTARDLALNAPAIKVNENNSIKPQVPQVQDQTFGWLDSFLPQIPANIPEKEKEKEQHQDESVLGHTLSFQNTFQKPDAEYFKAATAATEAVVNNSRNLRLAFLVGERAIGGIGSFTSAGLSASKLLSPRHGRYNGVTLLWGTQVLQYAPDSNGATSTVRNGLAVFWQDRVSRIVKEGDDPAYGEINRWGTQVGVEYNFHNSLQLNDAYGLFVRQRLSHYVEFSISGGKSANGRAYFGFSLGQSISL